MSSPKFHTLKVKQIKKETADSVSITFDIPDELKNDYIFKQGQSLTFRKNFKGEEIRRSYSICSSPFDDELRIGVKQVENGIFSTFANTELKTGDDLEVMTPIGHFYTELNPAIGKNYCAFAAGSGITPILGIIKATLITEPKSTFTLIYGNKNTGSIMFLEDIEALKNKYLQQFTVFHVLSRESVDVPILNGRINSEKCKDFFDKKLIDPQKLDEVFVCGPEDMILAVKEIMIKSGLDSKHIHFELFTTPAHSQIEYKTQVSAPTKKDSVSKANVSVKIDGITYQMDLAFGGDSILDTALKAGADLPYACKGGVCCTCRAKVTKGSVNMDMNFSLEDDEVERGYILTCQSHPTSDEVFVDFDIK